MREEPSILRARLSQALEEFDSTTAIFIGERLVAEFPNSDDVRLQLARALLQAGRAQQATGLLRAATNIGEQSRFLLAHCLFLQQMYVDAELTLYADNVFGTKNATNSRSITSVPCGAAGFFLLGQIAKQTNRSQEAILHFQRCLQMDSMHFAAFEALCKLGVEMNGDDIPFKVPFSEEDSFDECQSMDVGNQPDDESTSVNEGTPAGPSGRLLFASTDKKQPAVSRNLNRHMELTPSTPNSPYPTNESSVQAKTSRVSFGSEANRLLQTPVGRASAFAPLKSAQTPDDANTPLVGNKHAIVAESTPSSAGFLRSKPLAPLTEISESAPAEAASARTSTLPSKSLASSLDTYARALNNLHLYRCRDCIDLLESLPSAHRYSAVVQALLGRAYFEMAQYAKSVEHYAKALRLEPERIDQCGAHYSSALWQLRRDTELAALAHRMQSSSASTKSHGSHPSNLTEANMIPTPWQAGSVDACLAIGNCLSLQKEHDMALKMFRKASEIDPQFAYAHTLAAHEHASCEDFEKALTEYRHAIRIDDRHYNAWYGLGHVYFRQDKHQLAIYHFQRAISIHPGSSVLHCYLGMVLQAARCSDEAIKVLRRAASLEQNTSQAQFQLALVLLSQRRPQEALVELHAVNARAPKEAAVHAALGRAYRSIGNLQTAVVHWTIALDLDPKDRGRVKNMMDRACKHENEDWNSDQDDEGDADDEGILHDSDLEQDGDEPADEEQGDEQGDEPEEGQEEEDDDGQYDEYEQ